MHEANYGVYGVRKVHAQLGREGVLGARGRRPVARCTTQRLMKDLGLRGISRARGPRTTVPGSGPDLRPDLVQRAFTANAPNQLWVADITYCRTFAGWVYAAFVVDVCSRRVVGWQLSTSLRTDLALDALNMGLWARAHDGHDTSTLVHHSDRGVQGGLNRSSQHLTISEVCSGTTSAASGSRATAGDAVPGQADAGSARGTRVLASHRVGQAHGGRCTRGRRVMAGRVAVVSPRWRDAAADPGRAHRSVLVFP